MTRARAVILARSTSSRLSAKQLRHIGPRRLIDHTLFWLRQSSMLGEIVLATPHDDELMADWATHAGVRCVSGHPTNVEHRFMEALGTDAQFGVLVSGDTPIIDHEALDRCLGCSSLLAEASNMEGVIVAQRSLFQVVHDAHVHRPDLHAHQFPGIRVAAEALGSRTEVRPVGGLEYKMSIDTLDDLMRHREIEAALGNAIYSVGNVIRLLESGSGCPLADVWPTRVVLPISARSVPTTCPADATHHAGSAVPDMN